VVTAYALQSDGTLGEKLGTTTTDENGRYRLRFAYQGMIQLQSEGGQYADEATGDQVVLQAQTRLRTMLASTDKETTASITPLTEMAAERVQTRLRTMTQSQLHLQDHIAEANSEVSQAFDLYGVDITATEPADLTQTQSRERTMNQKKYGAILAGFCQVAKLESKTADSVMEMIQAMVQDMQDGSLGGNDGDGTSISVSTEVVAPLQARNQFRTAVQNFYQNQQRNQSGMAISDFDPVIPQN